MLVDSHCHLDFPDFAEDLSGVLTRAHDTGVGHMLTICTHVTKFDQVLALAKAHDQVSCTIGIHPHNAGTEPAVSADYLTGLADHPKVVGIGESGLDYHYDFSPRAAQEASFRTHIQACLATGLPLVVHAREADADIEAVLRAEIGNRPFRGVMHCFSSGRELAEAALEMGFHISFSGVVTFKSAEALREIAASVPRDRLLVETDAPYLAPVPMRGKRNEPAFVRHTAELMAELHEMELADFARLTTDNFFALFSKARRPA